MKALFFEDPFWLYGLLIIAEAVLVTLWWRGRERAQALRCFVPLGLGVVVFAVATLVVTDREKIQRATKQLVDNVTAGRVDTLEKLLDEDFRGTFRGRTMNRTQTLVEARRVMAMVGIKAVEIKKQDIQVKGPDAHQRLQTLIRYGGKVGGAGRVPVLWRIHWIRTKAGWKIYEVSEPQLTMGL